MKEMCRNFVCNNNRCPQSAANSPRAASAENANTLTVTPVASMGNCNACVMERIGLARTFIPTQPYEDLKDQEQSLVCGTVFSELSMPYCSGWNLYRFGKEA